MYDHNDAATITWGIDKEKNANGFTIVIRLSLNTFIM